MSIPVLEGRGLKKSYPVKTPLGRVRGVVRAVDGVSFALMPSEILGVVGESGCGKSTLARLILCLEPLDGGQLFFMGREVTTQVDREMADFRRMTQIVFQDPFSSLNPRMKVGTMLREPLLAHRILSSKVQARKEVAGLLERVGLSPQDMERYPHQFSGGQRQRIGIARALVLDPRVVVADEPTSSLDAFVQAQVVNLMLDLMEERGLSYIFISHNLSLVGQIAHRIMVLYLGQVMETGPARQLVEDPVHPYTRLLLDSVPVPDPTKAHLDNLPPLGDVPSPLNPPPGCPFHPRCLQAREICGKEEPPLRDVGGCQVACHLV
jgi:oligopeptide transport system ATP-binding protein